MAQHNQPSSGVVAHALTALGAHIGAHQLPNPSDITVKADRVVLSLAGRDAAVWRRSVLADSVKRDGMPGSAIAYVVLTGRLPDSGVRVQLEWLRRSPATSRRTPRLAVAR